MESKIYCFNPAIYPTRLYVAINPTFEQVDEQFYFLDENNEVIDEARNDFEISSNAIATTFVVAHKLSHWKGCLVAIWRRKECGSGVCAHEATHVCDWMDRELGLNCHEFDNDEPRAYLVQWIANCIDKVLRGKAEEKEI